MLEKSKSPVVSDRQNLEQAQMLRKCIALHISKNAIAAPPSAIANRL